MARLSENPDRDFSAGCDKAKPDLFRLMAEPPASLEKLFESPAIREHIGRLIVSAMRKSEQD
jgi:hypothetical protein